VSNLRLAGASSVSLYGASCQSGATAWGPAASLEQLGRQWAAAGVGHDRRLEDLVAPFPPAPFRQLGQLAGVGVVCLGELVHRRGGLQGRQGPVPLVVAESGFVRLASARHPAGQR